VSADPENSDTPLERRVAALEAAVEALRYPLTAAAFPAMSEEDATRFQEELDAAADDWQHKPVIRLLPSSLTVLDPEMVQQLIRECVTVVRPGETLVIRDRNWTPGQVREIQDYVDALRECGQISFKVLAAFGDELGVVQTRTPDRDFMRETRIDTFRNEEVESVRLTHLPTGIVVDAPTEDEAVMKLAAELHSRGDISRNDARRAYGLPELTAGPA
jgi:hypothetical protein